MIRPIAEVIKYNPTREVVAAEWTGTRTLSTKPQAQNAPRKTFGKKGAK